MADTFSTTESDWQGVDDEPTTGSDNLVKSGGVALEFEKLKIEGIPEVKIYSKEKLESLAEGVYLSQFDNLWHQGTLSKGTFIQLPSGVKRVTISAQSIDQTGVAFLTTNEYTYGESPSFADDFTSIILIPASGSSTFYFSNDSNARYVYVRCDTIVVSGTSASAAENVTIELPNLSRILTVSDIVDNLTDGDSLLPLSAKQGKILDSKIGRYEEQEVTKNIPVSFLGTGYVLYATGVVEPSQLSKYSDYIDISDYAGKTLTYLNNVYTISTPTNVGLAFYDSDKKYISGNPAIINGSERGCQEDNTLIPITAKYVRFTIFADYETNFYAKIIKTEEVPVSGIAKQVDDIESWISSLPETINKKPSNGGLIFFSVTVNVGFSTDVNSKLCQTTSVPSISYCCLRLPLDYNEKCKPYTLIICNHGAGTNVTANTCSYLELEMFDYLVDELKYPVLMVSGLPVGVRQSWMPYESQGIHFGNQYCIDNINKAYGYVIDKYNIRKDGCFMIGISMGGLACNNTINNIDIPILAVALNAPVIDPYLDAWNSSWGLRLPQTMAYLFNFNNFKVENNVPYFSIDNGNTWVEFTNANQAQLNVYFYQNLDKMQGFNPPYNKRFYVNPNGSSCPIPEIPSEQNPGVVNGVTTFDYTHYGVEYKAPLKIWHSENDNANYVHLSQNFIKLVKNGGQYAEMRLCPEGTAHGVWRIDRVSSEAIIISQGGRQITVYTYELGLWLNKWKRN